MPAYLLCFKFLCRPAPTLRAVFFLGLLLGCGRAFAQSPAAKEAAYERLQKTTTYGRDAKAGKFYRLRGFGMYCEVYGAGPPLLLIHGNGSSISAFAKQIPYFAKTYRVIVADSRGHGKSVNRIDSLSYEMMADDYAALLTALHVDSARVLGWSDGGINGLLLAIRHPEKVKMLAVTGANLRPDTTAVEPDVLRRVTRTYTKFNALFKQPQPKTPLDSLVHKYFRLLVEQPHISRAALHQIAVPTLVIGGDHDVIRPAHTLEIFASLRQAYLWILPNSGHSTLVAYAEEFNKTVDAFFKTPYRKIEDRAREF
ncbi:alpha/beta fold hydrolase [Hymenobacter caeli]|uniref:Pimeloyl-ACP methyl ester carboxylesterase n=1 Tax=Hymenobacter caeli TaxID=2735894 RepID=A0ABX2FMZ1_9BACT|nr:alpha/beta hydrolase [Hymenobacter caeli]NRT18386.1 pimeloyl-ACP methyl ester carboxylesterase [Hymenobacter caeli]